MFKKSYLGLDLNVREMRAAALQRVRKSVQLKAARILPLADELFAFSAQEPNVLDPKRFVENLQELLAPMAGREEQLAVSLPDRVGRILLTEVDTVFKSQAEGTDILKWKLKNSLPGSPHDIQLDYQALDKNERGQTRILVSLVHRAVLAQYEELIAEAGFKPAIVDFHSMNLYNFYRPRLDLGQDFVLVSLEGNTLSLQFFHDRMPFFFRVLEVASEPARIFHEVDRSVVRHRNHPGFSRASVFLHCDWERCDEMLGALKSVFDREVTLLDPRIDRMGLKPVHLPGDGERSLVASIGVAERLT
ncbi:MAG: pilus assembly protein PilM [Desulfuromonadales bacterium]|nr:pilus assembly protein PilM [Desulfuromonadales bacterium]NIR34151.1 pilus assembly protein PilM [Desulfuromonadales bacterium]NIS40234.1 pilus assembly protein PilM [Desulfuromonadales bacterium]